MAVVREDGRKITVQSTLVPVRGRNRKIIAVLNVFVPVPEERREKQK